MSRFRRYVDPTTGKPPWDKGEPKEKPQQKKSKRTPRGKYTDPTTGKPPDEEEPQPETDIQKAIGQLKEEVKETILKQKTTETVSEKIQEAGPGSVYETLEYRQYVASGQEIRQAIETAPEPLKPITKAPEGYYYRGADVQAYNEKVREYNNRLRDYKRQLNDAYRDYRAGLITYDAYEVQRKSYETQMKLYEAELKRTEPQRQAFLEYVQSIGPPEPTEEERARAEAGLPVKGLPGPAAVPPKGSITEKLQGAVSEALELSDSLFKIVTDPMREEAAKLNQMSIDLAMESNALAGFGAYALGTTLRTGATAFDVATFELRPQLWVDVGRTIGEATFNPEARTAIANEALRDPFGLIAEVAGGALLGGALKVEAERVGGKLKKAWIETKTVPYSISKEAYYPSEYEMGLQYPEEAVSTEPTYRTFEKRWLKFQSEGIKGELPYYGATEAKTPGVEPKPFEPPSDDWSVEQLTREADTAIPYEYGEEGGFLRVKGGYGGMKPFTEPREPMAPRSEQLVVTAEAAPNTKITNLIRNFDEIKIETELEFIPDIETIVTHRAGYRFITPETITQPTGFKPIDISAAAILQPSKIKSIDKAYTIPTVDLKQIEKQTIEEIEKPQEVELPKLKQPTITGITPIEIQEPSISEIQKPTITQIQMPRLSLPTVQLPELSKPVQPSPPEIPSLPYIEPPRTPRIKLDLDIEYTKEKKKRKRRKRDIFEFRVDIKEPKLPDIGKITFKEPKVKL